MLFRVKGFLTFYSVVNVRLKKYRPHAEAGWGKYNPLELVCQAPLVGYCVRKE
jgi:hypothetical protein